MNAFVDSVAILSSCQQINLSAKCLVNKLVLSEVVCQQNVRLLVCLLQFAH